MVKFIYGSIPQNESHYETNPNQVLNTLEEIKHSLIYSNNISLFSNVKLLIVQDQD